MTLLKLERLALAVVAAILDGADLEAEDGPLSLLDRLDREQLVDVLVAVTALLVREWGTTAGAAGIDRRTLLAATRMQLARLADREEADGAR